VTRSNAAAIDVKDVSLRLNLEFKTEGEINDARKAPTTAALTQFSDAPTLRAIAYDLDRVAASTSDDPEGARADWAKRRVNEHDENGNRTDKPRIVALVFNGTRRTVQGVEDLGIAGEYNLPGTGTVEVQPLFVAVDGLDYVVRNSEGTLVPTRTFYGTLYAPRGDKGPCKFVPVEFADKSLIERWNGLVDLGIQSGTRHGDWPKITHVDLGIGRLKRLSFNPLYRLERTYKEERRGRTYERKISTIGSFYGKALQMHPKSQAVPADAIEQNQEAWKEGQDLPNTFVFRMTERYGSLELMLLGREGDTNFNSVQIQSGVEVLDPFGVLGVSITRFDADKMRSQLEDWKTLAVDANPLYKRAMEIGRIVEGMSRASIRVQLEELGREAYRRACQLWNDAVNGAWDEIKRHLRSLPTLEDCLAGSSVEQLNKRLNRDDVLANWISQRLAESYSHSNLAHRELRRRLIAQAEQIAEKAAKEAKKAAKEAKKAAKEAEGSEHAAGNNAGEAETTDIT